MTVVVHPIMIVPAPVMMHSSTGAPAHYDPLTLHEMLAVLACMIIFFAFLHYRIYKDKP